MKKTIFRLSALVISLVMLLTVFVGCNKPDGTIDNGDNTDYTDNTNKPDSTDATDSTDSTDSTDATDSTDDPTVNEPIQIATTIYEISKHGNLVLYMYGSDLFDKGFEHGDIVEIAIGDKKWDVPLGTSYSDVDNGEAVLRATGAADGVVLAINMGDFATTAGIAEKTTIQEEPGYRWDYLMESPVEITITMKEEGGYREEWLIRQLVRTNERADYAHLSDEAFANFRVISTTGMGKNVLYRSSSPINPELGRNTYADKAAEKAGIITVVNFADNSNIYEGTENSYYSTCQVVYVNLGMDFLSESTLNGLAEGMRFIINNNGPYLIHCNEGKDRAGFVSALLECLMGATMDEVIDDYMLTYYNYYGVEKGTEKYDAVLKNNLIKVLNTTFKVDDVYKADLAAEAAAFLMEDAGLTADEVAALKGKLTITMKGIYDAAQPEAIFKNHQSISMREKMDGELWRERYLTKEYCCDYFYAIAGLSNWSEFITDDAYYYYMEDSYISYLGITPDGMTDFANLRAERYLKPILSEDALKDTIESVSQEDGRIIVKTFWSQDVLTENGMTSGKFEYVLDAETREIISYTCDYTFDDGMSFSAAAEISYDAEMPERVKTFLKYAEQTEDLRNVTVVSNSGADNEKTESVQVPKGLIVGFRHDEEDEYGFDLYVDAACTESYDPYVNTDSDLTIYVKWSVSDPNS